MQAMQGGQVQQQQPQVVQAQPVVAPVDGGAAAAGVAQPVAASGP